MQQQPLPVPVHYAFRGQLTGFLHPPITQTYESVHLQDFNVSSHNPFGPQSTVAGHGTPGVVGSLVLVQIQVP
jgi:hypothetical protein